MNLLGIEIRRAGKGNVREAGRTLGSERANPSDSGWWPEDILERNPALRLPRRWYTYRRMIREVPIIAAFSHIYTSLVCETEFSFGEDDAEAERARMLMGALLEHNSLRKLADSLLYGFSLVAWVAEDGYRIVKAYSLPHFTIVKANIVRNEVVSFTQHLDDGREYVIPARKCAYALNGNAPYGDGGLLRDVATQSLRYLQNSSLVSAAAEVNLKNLPNWYVPDEPGVDSRHPVVRSIREMDKGMNAFTKMTLANSDVWFGKAADGTERPVMAMKWRREYPPRADVVGSDLMERLEKQIGQVLGMESFTLGQSTSGSYALAEVQAKAFIAHLRRGVSIIRSALQKVLDYQYDSLGLGMAPRISTDWTALATGTDLADFIFKTAQAGITPPLAAAQEAFRRNGLPIEGLGEDSITPGAGQGGMGGDEV